MKLRYDLNSMTPGILASPRLLDSKMDDHADLTLTGGLNSFTLRGSAATIRALLTDAIAVLDQVQADGITQYGPPVRLSDMPAEPVRPAPAPGEHGQAILAQRLASVSQGKAQQRFAHRPFAHRPQRHQRRAQICRHQDDGAQQQRQ